MSAGPTLSVALGTYNGERFLPAQLESIRIQSRPPDELIVCDDASDDRSADIVKEFAAQAGFPVEIRINPNRLGVAANYSQAIGLCHGEMIATCDQDDLWKPEKLARLMSAFTSHPDAGLAFSDAEVVDEQLRPTGRTLWETVGLGSRERTWFERGEGLRALVHRNFVTGAMMAFRRRYLDLVLPIPPDWLHDAWLALLISSLAPIVAIPNKLVLYRQHAEQQIGAPPRNWSDLYRTANEREPSDFREVAERFAHAGERLAKWPNVPRQNLRLLEEKVKHAQARARMREPGHWRLPGVWREFRRGNYSRFSRGWKAAVQDLFLP